LIRLDGFIAETLYCRTRLPGLLRALYQQDRQERESAVPIVYGRRTLRVLAKKMNIESTRMFNTRLFKEWTNFARVAHNFNCR
jgi:hypothetical protein